jgi:hypothetical protein
MSSQSPALSPLHPHPRLLVRWFVQYNPTFTASALCMLGGVLVLSRAIGADADVGLTAVLELYQWLLIGTAALLSRRLLDHRPAAILGVIALVFLADPTLQQSALATSGHALVSLVTVTLFAAKLHALAWAFRLKLNASARALPVLGSVVVVTLPHMRVLGLDGEWLPTALALAVFALATAALLAPPRVTSVRVLGDVGSVMFPRLVRAAALLGVVGFVFQAWNATFAIGPEALIPSGGALLLAFSARARSETQIWSCLVGGLLLVNSTPALGLFSLPLGALALVIAARRAPPRVLCAALFLTAMTALTASARMHEPLSSPPVFVAIAVTTLGLLALLVTRRAWSAVPALAIVHASWLDDVARALAPQGAVQWGGLLLTLGFVLLPAGVVLHRRLSRVLAQDELARERAATAEGPSTSAAMGTAVLG